MQKSLNSIRNGTDNLNSHRQNLLKKIPQTEDWAYYKSEIIEIKDLAYLSAKAGHEFAWLKGKHNDIIFHGSSVSCEFRKELAEMLISGKYFLEAHSHPGEEYPLPSIQDRQYLIKLNQNSSKIVSGITGRWIEFSRNAFDLDF